MNPIDTLRNRFFEALGDSAAIEALFDRVADTVYFLKDSAGRYMSVNQTLVERCGCSSKQELIGRSAQEVFPPPLGEQIAAQDQYVLKTANSIQAKLELHLYASRRQGWCLTWKEPLRSVSGELIGLSGISRDLPSHTGLHTDISRVSLVLRFIQEHIDQPLRLPELAGMAQLSAYQLDNRIRSLFGLSPGQYITRARIDHACNRLRQTDKAISTIALDCGYSDQAAFSRQFRRSVGLSPAAYRRKMT